MQDMRGLSSDEIAGLHGLEGTDPGPEDGGNVIANGGEKVQS
ncbi:MAG: hypothetical protein ACN6ON_02750 [Sphingobacterium sp.]